MATKTDALVSAIGACQDVATRLAPMVEKRGGNLTRALIELRNPGWDEEYNMIADILAYQVCRKAEVRACQACQQEKTEIPASVEKIIIFDHVAVLDFPGLPAFNTDDFFTTDTPKGEKVKFTYVSENFKSWFGGMKVAATQPSKLSLDRLNTASYDPDIIKEIGEENCDQSLAIIRWHIQSGLAKKNGWYAGYFLDNEGVRRAVRWRWDGLGWRVIANEVPYPYRWLDGYEFVSRKPLAT